MISSGAERSVCRHSKGSPWQVTEAGGGVEDVAVDGLAGPPQCRVCLCADRAGSASASKKPPIGTKLLCPRDGVDGPWLVSAESDSPALRYLSHRHSLNRTSSSGKQEQHQLLQHQPADQSPNRVIVYNGLQRRPNTAQTVKRPVWNRMCFMRVGRDPQGSVSGPLVGERNCPVPLRGRSLCPCLGDELEPRSAHVRRGRLSGRVGVVGASGSGAVEVPAGVALWMLSGR
ncbi:hypothetical protein AOLI_G00081160 [Acnodon oligacanthus]